VQQSFIFIASDAAIQSPADGASTTPRALQLEARADQASTSEAALADRQASVEPPAQPFETAEAPVHDVPERSYPSDFSWSHSKDGMLSACARRFGLHYVLSRGGARADAAPDVQEAFRLKQLKSLPAEVGSAVHKRAAECALAIMDGLPLPTLDVLVSRTRAELNALATSSRHLPAFEAHPERVEMLREVYYGTDTKLRPELVARARETMLTALETLYRAPLWEELRCVPNPRVNILVPDRFTRFDYRGRHVYAAPDLVFRRPKLADEASPWTIVDWKVSRRSNDGDISQVAVYGITVEAGFGWPLVEGCEGRVINLLLDQVDQFALTSDDLVDAGKRIIDGTDRLWQMLMDENGVPRLLTRDDFAMTPQLRLCETCVFKAACHGGIAAALAARAPDAA
jgi:hypothetical protein